MEADHFDSSAKLEATTSKRTLLSFGAVTVLATLTGARLRRPESVLVRSSVLSALEGTARIRLLGKAIPSGTAFCGGASSPADKAACRAAAKTLLDECRAYRKANCRGPKKKRPPQSDPYGPGPYGDCKATDRENLSTYKSGGCLPGTSAGEGERICYGGKGVSVEDPAHCRSCEHVCPAGAFCTRTRVIVVRGVTNTRLEGLPWPHRMRY